MAFVAENLDVKTLYGESPAEIDEKCKKFKENNLIKFTQSNAIYDSERKKIVYIYTLFYKPKEGKQETKVVEKVVKEEENKPVSRPDFVSPKMILTEEEAKWVDCGKCQARWKWTHYRMCPNKHGIEALPEQYHNRYKEIWGMEDGNKKDNQEDKGV